MTRNHERMVTYSHAPSHLEALASNAGVKVGEVMSPATTATILGVTVATVRRWVREGRLGAVRVSPRVTFIRRDELDAFLASPPSASGVA